MTIDPYGRVIFSEEDLFTTLMKGRDIDDLFSVETQRYNQLCLDNDKLDCLVNPPPPIDMTVRDFHEDRKARWLYPPQYQDIDLWGELRNRCGTDVEIDRLEEERGEYEKRDLNHVLRLMLYLVDSFRERNVVWGVGRGSSVASFALYLIGITKINPMKYGLEIGEFLRE